MKKNIINALFVGVFLALCASLIVGTFIFGTSESAANEKLTDKPSMVLKDEQGNTHLNTAYLSELQSYVNDRFFLRQELITLDRRMSSALGVSGESRVIAGKDGWLFFTETLDDYTGTNMMTNRELFSAASNVALMEEYCRKNGKDFTFIVAPNKNALYGQYMPSYGVTAKTTNAKLFHSLLDQMEVEYVDLFAAFGEQEEPLYFAHDSHWNSKGAALGADLINASFGVESNYFGGDFSYAVAHDGDLYAMVYPGAQDTEMNPIYGGQLQYSFQGPSTQPNASTLITQSEKPGSLVCYRDSFGILLFPYLADSYGSAKFSRSVNYDLTGSEKCVAIELVERNLCYLIQKVPVMPSPVRTMELPEAVSGTVQVTTPENARAGSGCVQLVGTLPKAPDADSCVYVVCDGLIYEAFCMENDGFAVNVPEGSKAQYVIYNIGGVPQMFEIK